MPFQTPNDMTPKKNSLVVCAGTVTCSTVGEMGSGFMLFKKLFKDNGSYTNYAGGWTAELQQILDNYHSNTQAMPAYIRVAEAKKTVDDVLIGGVATVPVRSGNTGLGKEHYSSTEEKEDAFNKQYKSAVMQAVLDAKELDRPLFLQPLGIGVYGWDPKLAARLFAEAICEADPEDKIDITIPIYQINPGSNDQLFKETFINEMAKQRQNPKKVEKEFIVEPKSGEKQENSGSKHPKDNKQILSTIINTIISNIENKHGGRWTSGMNSQKVSTLRAIQQSINQEQELEDGEFHKEIMDACQLKRNLLHFWHTPDSVNEYLDLLKQNNIEYAPIITVQLNKDQ